MVWRVECEERCYIKREREREDEDGEEEEVTSMMGGMGEADGAI